MKFRFSGMWIPRLASIALTGRESCRRILFADSYFLQPSGLSLLDQIRGRKRCLKKPLTKQEKLERRLKREEKEAKRKQYSFMQRIQIRQMSKLLSPSQQYPGRYDAEAEAALPEHPADRVAIRAEHRTQFHSIAKALELHRFLQAPSMFNHPDGILKLRFELNMTTEKAVCF